MLIPYLGEKTKFKNFITPNIPTEISTYVEPFGGMFGVYFSLDLDIFKNVQIIYNDINYLNYNLFINLNNDYFIQYVNDINVDYEFYIKCLSLLDIEDNFYKAVYWLVVLCCSSPYEIGKDSWRGNREFEIFKLKYSSYRLQLLNIDKIYNLDYMEIIEKYDSKDTFFYLDPPYKGKESYYLNHNFSENSHYEMAEILNSIKGRFLLSYYNFDDLSKLYASCNFMEKKTIMGTEILIKNF